MMTDLFFILIGLLAFIGWSGAIFLYIKTSKVDQGQNNEIRDIERRLTDLLTNQMKEVKNSQIKSSESFHGQIKSFTEQTTHLREDLKQIYKKVESVSSFQEIFKSPKLRGQWGEASLNYILTQHYPAELWKSQHTFSSGEQVDAILKLPDNKLLPIDSKFSSDNFERMIYSNTDDERKSFEQSFLRDLKLRVDEISSKYIIPSEGTVDFALMYIPAEAIYYEIMFNLRERGVADYAWKKKVVLTSPNTIYLTLRAFEQWFKDTQISKKTQGILKRLNRINQDASKLMNDFRKLGSHLKNATSSYDNSEKRLNLFSDRVERLLEVKQDKPKQLKD
ncbi:MAG: DNA recombination protein RmuC [Patescibacteria group bacterium]|nr:DNA recombination protein RmuC [Patescibacteria group bacterium]